MPYKSETIKIEGTKFDKRIKLTQDQRDKIADLKGKISRRLCAEMFGVSKRTIDFIWYPERLERNKQLRQERGGWRQYYNKNEWREYMKEHRHHKQELFLTGKITIEGDCDEKRLF